VKYILISVLYISFLNVAVATEQSLRETLKDCQSHPKLLVIRKKIDDLKTDQMLSPKEKSCKQYQYLSQYFSEFKKRSGSRCVEAMGPLWEAITKQAENICKLRKIEEKEKKSQ